MMIQLLVMTIRLL